MKLHVHHFKSNNGKTIEDIIESIHYDKSDNGIIRVRFKTADKYLIVDDDWTAFTPEYEGCGISFKPHLYDGDVYLDPYVSGMVQAYIEHDDWWSLEFVLETGRSYVSVVTPLKHEYLWMLIPYDIAYGNYANMEPIEIDKGDKNEIARSELRVKHREESV